MEALNHAAHREPGAPLPVLVVTGFLGAGKTSLLNHLLGGAPGLRIAAIVNDFGSLDVDASRVAGRVDSVISLSNGCMCCEVDAAEITDALRGLADEEHGLDLAVIEASGLAEPFVLARMVHDAPVELVAYAGMVQVVDAEHLSGSLERHPQLARHLAQADLVVVNKCDLVGRNGVDAVAELVRRHAPRVAIVPAVRGAVPVGLLLGLDPAGNPSRDPGADADGQIELIAESGDGLDERSRSGHLHEGYQSFTVTPETALHPRRALAALSSPPVGVYRAKGTVSLAVPDGRRTYEVALVGRRLEFRAADTGVGGLVVIGVDMPERAEEFLDAAALAPGETVDEADLLGIHPYLVADSDASDVEEWIYDELRPAPTTGRAQMLADPEDPDALDPAFTP